MKTHLGLRSVPKNAILGSYVIGGLDSPRTKGTEMTKTRYQIEWNDACLLGDKAAKNKVRDTHTGKVVWEGTGQGNTIMAEQDFSWGVRTA